MRIKKTYPIFIFLIISYLGVNAQLFDDFSDGDFTNNPTWTGSEDLFVVENEVLRSNSPGAAEYYLSTPSEIMDETEWKFYINLNFSPTSANYVDMYLVADNADLTQVQNGYFLRFGGTPKEISLFKKVNGSQSMIIDGEDNVLGSSNNKFNIHVTRTADGFWNVMYDKNLTGTFTQGGSVMDNEITSTAHFGIFIKQSTAATPVNNHFFDNFIIQEIEPDLTPPSVLGAVATSATEIEVTFDEPVDQATAENVGNYNVLNDGINVSAAQLSADNPAKVNLTLSAPIGNGETISLQISAVEDLAGNVMETQTIDVFYVVPEVAEPKDLVFNEIFADPNPSVAGLPEEEFLELFNASDKIFDMKNWVLVNTSTPRTLSSMLVFPGEYLIVCHENHAPLFEPYGKVLGVPSFVVLANAADSLTLINPEGNIIDIVSYKNTWYNNSDKANGGYSLELINPFTPCSGKSNWSASNSPMGATPGEQNSIFDDTPDTTPPIVESVSLINNSLVQIRFNEVMNPESLINGSYTWNFGIETQNVNVLSDHSAVQLSLSEPLEIGNEYVLVLNGLVDCVGNEMEPNTEVIILIGAEPDEYDLIISEIMADPSPPVGLPDGEYFELYNAGDKPFELQGMALNNKPFVNQRVVAPGEYVICIDANLKDEFSEFDDLYLIPGLGLTFFTNAGKDLTLYNQSGQEIDRVNYRLSWYGDKSKQEGGYSLERINLYEACRGGDNWTASIDPKGGTPGEVNSVNDNTPDTTPPTVTQVYVQASTQIELVFSEPLDELSVLTAHVEINPEVAISDMSMTDPEKLSVIISLSESLQSGLMYSLSVNGFADCMGNVNTETEYFDFGLPEMAQPGDVLINEVLFNPRTGGSDFVEIVNVSDKVISLQNWSLENQTGTKRTITTNPVVIFPGAYMVFTQDVKNIIQEYPFGKPENYFQMESLPSYNNSSGSVILNDGFGDELDRLDYLESYHFALLRSFKGVSLERISFTRPTNDPQNWTSAAEKVGYATPGYINSQHNVDGKARNRFEFENEVFSPDNDGFNDQLILHYLLQQPGYVATIEIYDQRGRIQKTLENNTLLATSGTISWDGVTDDQIKARIGPHIMVVHLFNLDGKTEVIKLPFVVAGKLSN